MYSVAVARSRPALLVLVASIALLLGGASLSSRTSDWSARSVPWICPSSSSSSSAFTSASDPDPTLAPGWVDAEGDFHSPGFHSFYKRIIELRGQDGATEILGLKEELPWMMNTTILFYADSVSRHLYHQLCTTLLAPMTMTTEGLPEGVPRDGWTVGHTCTEPSTGFTAVHYHTFGFHDLTSEKGKKVAASSFDRHGTGFWAHELRLPIYKAMALPTPDIVFVGGGAWDAKYMFKRDVLDQSHFEVIPDDDLDAIVAGQSSVFSLLRSSFPSADLVWIELHRFSTDDLQLRWEWAKDVLPPGSLSRVAEESELLPPLFNNARIAQHASALRRGAKLAGIDSLDYWEVSNSFTDIELTQPPRDPIHPQALPARALLGMLLEKVYRLRK